MPNEIFESMAGMVFLKSNGASFSGTLYPKLALAYPGLKLADLRGEFIRGWDDGRGVDTGRELLSNQAFLTGPHNHDIQLAQNPAGDANVNNLGWGANQGDFIPVKMNSNTTTFPVGAGSRYMKANNTTGTETRPRNVAFNYIVRAA